MDSHTLFYIFHLLFVAPLFLYVGIVRKDAPSWVFSLLLVLSVGIFLYHASLAWGKLSAGKSAWVNWIHMGLIAPLLAYVGWNRQESSRPYFEMLLMLGFTAAGYHGYYLARAV
jgi:hypothetical protein